MFFEIPKPFDLALTLQGGQAFRWHKRGLWYQGVLRKRLIRLRESSRGLEICDLSIDTEFSSQKQLFEEDPHFAEELSSYFRLEDDLDLIYGEMSKDASLSRAIKSCWGLRLLRQDPWECLASFICSVDSNIPKIMNTIERLAQVYGEPILNPIENISTFPTALVLADAGEEALRSLGLGFRAPFLWKTAQRVARGELELHRLFTISYEEAKAQLLTLPGVGDKVADCTLAFSLDKSEAFPIDRWVRRALEEEYLNGHRLSDRKLGDWARERFGFLGSYAQQYLFQWKRSQNKSGIAD
jgi:N-glycosylase/DNA lyase